jgi:hypothetical protein
MKDLCGGLFVWYTQFNHYKATGDSLRFMIKPGKRSALFTTSLLALLILGIAVLLLSTKVILVDGKLYTLAENYSPPDGSGILSGCAAMMPECGVCASSHGAVLRGDSCYIGL